MCLCFKPERGVYQGCQLSSSLFVLCVEILADTIRNDNSIKGIKILDKELKLSQSADDTHAFGSTQNLQQMYSNFSQSFKNVLAVKKTKVKLKECG